MSVVLTCLIMAWFFLGLLGASKALALDVRYQPMPLVKYGWQVRCEFWRNMLRGPFCMRFGLWQHVLIRGDGIGYMLPTPRAAREAWRLQYRECHAMAPFHHPRRLRRHHVRPIRRWVTA